MVHIHIHHHYHHIVDDKPRISSKILQDSKKVQSPEIKKIQRKRLVEFAKQRAEKFRK